jgi:hypothetical protein
MAAEVLHESRGTLSLTSGLRVHAGRYLHDGAVPAHTHGFAELVVVLAGTGVHASHAGRRSLRVGDAVLLRPGLWHSYEDCDGLEHVPAHHGERGDADDRRRVRLHADACGITANEFAALTADRNHRKRATTLDELAEAAAFLAADRAAAITGRSPT